MGTTTYYSLSLCNDSTTKFQDWREAINKDNNGGSTTSDMEKIDAALHSIEGTASGKANPSSTVTATLAAASWSGASAPYTQTVTVTGLGATQNGVVSVSQSATSTQYESARKAMLGVTAQAANSLTITAYGTKPTVDIPIVVILMG